MVLAKPLAHGDVVSRNDAPVAGRIPTKGSEAWVGGTEEGTTLVLGNRL